MSPLPVLHSRLSLLHDPPFEILDGEPINYFESPSRYHNILEALFPSNIEAESFESQYTNVALDWTSENVLDAALLEAIREVHGANYLDYLETIYKEWVAEGGSPTAVFPETFFRADMLLDPDQGYDPKALAIDKAGRFSFDLSCPITSGTWTAALASAKVAIAGAERILADPKLPGVFALCRPPGHHAASELCGGYCYINNVAVACRALQRKSPLPGARCVILDIDYHHGNGTSKIFYSDPSVLYISLHGSPDYPYYTGARSEKGSGKGVGANINYPLPRGTDDDSYLQTLKQAAADVRAFAPDYLLVSLGVDTFEDDPLTHFKITLARGFPRIGHVIGELNLPTLFCMEGGYNLDNVGLCVKAVLDGYIAQKIS